MTAFWILVCLWTVFGPFLFMAAAGAQKCYTSNAWVINDLLLVILCGPVLWFIAIALLVQLIRK